MNSLRSRRANWDCKGSAVRREGLCLAGDGFPTCAKAKGSVDAFPEAGGAGFEKVGTVRTRNHSKIIAEDSDEQSACCLSQPVQFCSKPSKTAWRCWDEPSGQTQFAEQ